jgi:hypothetical protein
MRTKRFIKAATLSLGLIAVAGLPATPFTASATAATIIAQSEHDAKAIEVIEASIVALGGRDKLNKVKSMSQKGTIAIPMAGIEGSISLNIMVPNKLLMELNIPMMGQTLTGLNDGVAWSTDAMNGPQILPEDQAKESFKQADLHSVVNYKKLHPTIEYVGEVEFDGQSAHKIRLVDKEESETFDYYSTKTHLQIGSETEAATPMGNIKAVTVMREYKELGAYMTPTIVEQQAGATTILFTFTDVEFNKVEESVFELPAAIKSLIAINAEDED